MKVIVGRWPTLGRKRREDTTSQSWFPEFEADRDLAANSQIGWKSLRMNAPKADDIPTMA